MRAGSLKWEPSAPFRGVAKLRLWPMNAVRADVGGEVRVGGNEKFKPISSGQMRQPGGDIEAIFGAKVPIEDAAASW
ncbi:MAG: hypothetical protein Hens2KO_27480 [Henriciella sp.]